MSMHGSEQLITEYARASLMAALGPTPVIVVDDLKGDASKGEPVSNGLLEVVDQEHPVFPGIINRRVVLAQGVEVRAVLVAVADRLTHAKAEAALRSLAALTGIPVRPVREKVEKPEDIDERRAQVVDRAARAAMGGDNA